jgi:hypothetical protein
MTYTYIIHIWDSDSTKCNFKMQDSGDAEYKFQMWNLNCTNLETAVLVYMSNEAKP